MKVILAETKLLGRGEQCLTDR